MIKEERDRFLLDELGPECTIWRELSEWSKFGFLWDWAKERDWWEEFIMTFNYSGTMTRGEFLISIVNLDLFMDILAEFLRQRKEKG